MNAHDHVFPRIDGEARIRLADFAGRPILLVDTASEGVTTPQYAARERLWQRYGPAGLVVVGVPSNDFGEREPDDETVNTSSMPTASSSISATAGPSPKIPS